MSKPRNEFPLSRKETDALDPLYYHPSALNLPNMEEIEKISKEAQQNKLLGEGPVAKRKSSKSFVLFDDKGEATRYPREDKKVSTPGLNKK